MTPIDAAIVIALLFLPLSWLVLRHVDQLGDPAYLRRHGVVITSERAIEAHSAPIGEYLGGPIWGSVVFKGMQYRFDRVQQKKTLGAGELFLDPGLVYRAE
jgi:hypothetical protein